MPPDGRPGRRGTVAIRPEAIGLLDAGASASPDAMVVDATVRTP